MTTTSASQLMRREISRINFTDGLEQEILRTQECFKPLLGTEVSPLLDRFFFFVLIILFFC